MSGRLIPAMRISPADAPPSPSIDPPRHETDTREGGDVGGAASARSRTVVSAGGGGNGVGDKDGCARDVSAGTTNDDGGSSSDGVAIDGAAATTTTICHAP